MEYINTRCKISGMANRPGPEGYGGVLAISLEDMEGQSIARLETASAGKDLPIEEDYILTVVPFDSTMMLACTEKIIQGVGEVKSTVPNTDGRIFVSLDAFDVFSKDLGADHTLMLPRIEGSDVSVGDKLTFSLYPAALDDDLERVTMRLLPKTVELVSEIKDDLGAVNRADAVRQALKLASIVIKAIKSGAKVVVEREGEDREILVVPALRDFQEE